MDTETFEADRLVDRGWDSYALGNQPPGAKGKERAPVQIRGELSLSHTERQTDIAIL